MAVRHRHFWLLRDNYLECGLCGTVKVKGKVYRNLYEFVLEFVENHFLEIFEPILTEVTMDG